LDELRDMRFEQIAQAGGDALGGIPLLARSFSRWSVETGETEGLDRRQDPNCDALAEVELLGPGQRHGEDRHAGPQGDVADPAPESPDAAGRTLAGALRKEAQGGPRAHDRPG